MNKVQNNVKEFMVKAEQDCPEKPTIPDEKTRILRIRLLLEEVLELAEASGLTVSANSVSLNNADDFDILVKQDVNLIDVADALSDISYVNYGAAIAYGLDLEPFEEEVQRSNMSKFIDGHRDENGKWVKGPSYTPVNLEPILKSQIT